MWRTYTSIGRGSVVRPITIGGLFGSRLVFPRVLHHSRFPDVKIENTGRLLSPQDDEALVQYMGTESAVHPIDTTTKAGRTG